MLLEILMQQQQITSNHQLTFLLSDYLNVFAVAKTINRGRWTPVALPSAQNRYITFAHF